MSEHAQPSTTWVNPLRDKRDKRMPRIAGPCAVVIFGVTGDLARKKLMPAIYDLANRGLLPPTFALVGFARRDWADEDFGKVVYDAVKQHARTPFRQEVWDRLAEGIRFVQGTFDDDEAFAGSPTPWPSSTPNAAPAAITRSTCRSRRRVPRRCCEQLSKSGLADTPDGCWSRVVIEKPFGHDLESAESLNARGQQRLPGVVGVPHRPLPGQGDRAEHPGAAVRQPVVRTRSGTPTTSTTCRSPWPRTSDWAAAAATTTASALPAT